MSDDHAAYRFRAFQGVARDDARAFASRWLPAWSGNRPDTLAAFYAEGAFYADPAVTEGLQGRPAIRAYFGKLLARNPDWVWRQIDATPLEHGFLNHWEAEIPTPRGTVVLRGVCTVILERGLIVRNEVFFDPGPWSRSLAPDTGPTASG